MIPSLEQFEGAVIGQCLGDALGFVVEGQSPERCEAHIREVVRGGAMPERFGQYSDESQMARLLLESFAAHAAFRPDDFAARLVELHRSGRMVGLGRTTSQALERLASGVPVDQAATPAPAAGNASAIRAVPVGLLFAHLPDKMIAVASEQSRVTHGDPRCTAGAVVVAGAVALATAGGTVQAGPFLQTLRRWCTGVEPQMASALHQLQDILPMPADKAAQTISRLGLPPGVDSEWRGGISAFVVSSVLWGLYSFLHHPDDWTEAVALAISPGGDVDTTAALAGALVGARRGLSAIPAERARRLTDQGGWGYEDLIGLVRNCRQALVAAVS